MTSKPGQAYIDEFKAFLTVKGLTTSKTNLLRPYFRYCEKNGLDCCNMDYATMQKFLLTMRIKYPNPGSYSAYLMAVRSFTQYLVECGKAPESVWEVVRKFKALPKERKIKSYITKDELIEIVDMAQTFYIHMEPVQIQAILYFMFYTGLRFGEVMRLRRSDIDLDKQTVIVKTPTKNKWERVVFFPKRIAPTKTHKGIPLVDILKEYFASEGEKNNAFNLTIGRFKSLFESINQFTPEKKFHPHMLRHSFARMLAKNQIDSRIAQKLLGHRDIATTMIYYDPDIDVMQDIYKEKIK